MKDEKERAEIAERKIMNMLIKRRYEIYPESCDNYVKYAKRKFKKYRLANDDPCFCLRVMVSLYETRRGITF